MKKYLTILFLLLLLLLVRSCSQNKIGKPIDPEGYYTTISCPKCDGKGCPDCDEGLRTIGIKADFR